MKKILLALPIALLVAGCSSSREGKKCDGKFDKLTAGQKACLKKEGCPKPEFKDGEKDKAAIEKFMKCKAKAFEACGIEKKDFKKKDK